MVVSNPDSGSSVLNPSVCIEGAAAVGSKLAITITQTGHGFTAGAVVRWNSGIDGNTAEYVTAKADNAYNAEVAGIVSEVLGANSFELTLSGTVNMTKWFNNLTGVIPGGATADDVYFLSGYTAGWMDVIRPDTPGWVAKPVITRLAEDSQGNIFGAVTNYVGSLLGGGVAVSLNDVVPVGSIQAYLGTSPPTGWSLCDGGPGDLGLPITNYPDYYNQVGLRYGWVETLKTDRMNWNMGSRIEQVSGDGSRIISGVVVGVSADGAGGERQWVYVKQSYNDNIPNNGNFSTKAIDAELGKLRGEGNAGATFDFAKNTFYNFRVPGTKEVPISATVYTDPYSTDSGESFNIYSDNSSVAGVYSCLVPDFRNKFLFGAEAANSDAENSDPHELNREGGIDRFSLEFEEGGFGGGLVDKSSSWLYQHNLPPYLSVNWIVRTKPNSYAALLNALDIKNLKLTNLPTSSTGQDQWTVYYEDSTLKIKTDA